MTNQTERYAFEKWYREHDKNLPEFNDTTLCYEFEIWQAATAYARQDERAKVIEECAKEVERQFDGFGLGRTNNGIYANVVDGIRALQSKG